MYYHFEYESGGNAYIAKSEEERDQIIARHEMQGEVVRELWPGFYIIEDTPKNPYLASDFKA